VSSPAVVVGAFVSLFPPVGFSPLPPPSSPLHAVKVNARAAEAKIASSLLVLLFIVKSPYIIILDFATLFGLSESILSQENFLEKQ
jgi:hypothetical protein